MKLLQCILYWQWIRWFRTMILSIRWHKISSYNNKNLQTSSRAKLVRPVRPDPSTPDAWQESHQCSELQRSPVQKHVRAPLKWTSPISKSTPSGMPGTHPLRESFRPQPQELICWWISVSARIWWEIRANRILNVGFIWVPIWRFPMFAVA